MDSWLHHRWLAVISFLFYVGGVQCDCTGRGIGIEGGKYKLTKRLHQGSVLVYQCPDGYYPFPDLSRQCMKSDRWDPEPNINLPQHCAVIKCPSPIVLKNGEVYPQAFMYLLGNETTYECYSGYTLKGSSRRVCQKNGKWDGRTPTCSEDSGSAKCPDPGIPPGAIRDGDRFETDDKVTYSCNEGMKLVGSKERLCKETNQWTGREPACYYKHTYDTPEDVSHAFGSAIIESLTTLQPTDDTQEARKIRILKNGTLNIYIAMDVSESIDEEHVKNTKEAVRRLIKKISSFTVTPNYEIIFFTSEFEQAVNILEFFDGTPNRTAMLNNIDAVKIHEMPGGTDLTKAFDHFLQQMTHIELKVGTKSFEDHYHVILVFTDGGFNEGGDPTPTVTRIKNKAYLSEIPGQHDQSREEHLAHYVFSESSGHVTRYIMSWDVNLQKKDEDVVAVFRIAKDIYVFGIGVDVVQETLTPLTVGTGGEHFFKMQDLSKLNEIFDKMIDESEVRGLCGLHRSFKTFDKDSARKENPWYAEVIVENEGVKKCFGSLVTPQFILTAAHCFRQKDEPKHISVEISGRKHAVKELILHKEFNVTLKQDEGVKEFYDYDVALIQLKEKVVISEMLRPICIPCTKDTRDALRLDKESTCEQQEKLLLGEDTVQLSFLTRTMDADAVDEVYVKDVRAKIRDSRDQCIIHALEAPNMKIDDPKIAVTDNFLCTGGTQPQVDQIACTGDSGGAVFKDYDYRKIQVGVVSWGTKKLCTSGGQQPSDEKSRDFHINVFKIIPFLKKHLGNDEQNDFVPLEFVD